MRKNSKIIIGIIAGTYILCICICVGVITLVFSISSWVTRPTGSIIFQSVKDGYIDLFSINLNGGSPVNLTNSPENDLLPTYISSINQIGFVSTRHTYIKGIYRMDTNGENLKVITDGVTSGNALEIRGIDWSPDGKHIAASMYDWGDACESTGRRCSYDIFVLNADGTNFENLTNSSDNDESPDWSSDGNRIVFQSIRDGDFEIYVMNKDGSNRVQLTSNFGYDGRPRWSPDGKKISFESDRNNGQWQVFIVNSDGSNPIQVTHGVGNEYFASWSPDGNWLVYLSDNSGDHEIFITSTDGRIVRQITNNSSYGMKFDFAPIWIP